MPCHCCVPQCSTRGYRDSDGAKVSFYSFPSDKDLKKKWIHAIRRDEGTSFQVTKTTVVCSRHFREDDVKKTLAGKHVLKAGIIPSVFAWVRSSPRKRKPPKERFFSHISKSLSETFSTREIESNNEESEPREPPERYEDVSTQTDFAQTDKLLHDKCLQEKDKTIAELQHKITDLQGKLKESARRIESLHDRVFSFASMKSNDSNAAFYTGYQSWDSFMAIYYYLDPGEKGENINFWRSSNTNTTVNYEDDELSTSKKGRSRSLEPIEEYFLVMCRLRQGFHEEHLAHLYDISRATVSRIFISWINFMYLKLGTINIWPSREVIDATMPEDFKVKYKATRVIIDCTEVKCQMPSSLQLNGELFSSYKHHTTLKALVGIAPGGAMTFISQLYTGNISDREIVTRSGFLDLPFQANDSVMADKGFTINDLLPLGVSLNLPPFLGGSGQMPAADVVKTQEIASLRIHIERAINKIKNFHIWDKVIPLSQFSVVNQMWAVCAILCNAQPNIISV